MDMDANLRTMLSRSLLVAIALSIAIVAATGAATAADGDQKVSIEKANENQTAIVQVASCEGTLCKFWTSTLSFDVYINGEKTESLNYDDQYRVENASYTNGSVNIAVVEKGFPGDKGWAYNVTQEPLGTQPTSEANHSQNNRRSSRKEATQQKPSYKVKTVELDDFDNCLDKFNGKHEFSEVGYCYKEQFD